MYKYLYKSLIILAVLFGFNGCGQNTNVTKPKQLKVKETVKIIKKEKSISPSRQKKTKKSTLTSQKQIVDIIAQLGHKGKILSFFLVDNDNYLVTTSYGKYNLWDLTSGKLVLSENPKGSLNNVTLSHNKKFIVFTVWRNKKNHLYYKSVKDFQSLYKGAQEITHLTDVHSPFLAFSPNDRYLLVANKDPKNKSSVIDLQTKKTIWKKTLDLKYYINDKSVKITDDGKKVYLYSSNYFIKNKPYEETLIIDFFSGKKISSVLGKKNYHKLFDIKSGVTFDHGNGVTTSRKNISYTLDGDQKWKVSAGCVTTGILLTQDKQKGVFTCYNGSLYLRSMVDGTVIHPLSITLGSQEQVHKVDNKHFLIKVKKNMKHKLVLWDINALKVVADFEGKNPKVINKGKQILFQLESKKKQYLYDKYIFDVKLKKIVKKFPYDILAFNMDSQYILGRKWGKKSTLLYLYDLNSGKDVKSFPINKMKKMNKTYGYNYSRYKIDSIGKYAYIRFIGKSGAFVVDLEKEKIILETKHYLDFAGFDTKNGKLFLKGVTKKSAYIQKIDLATKKYENKLILEKSSTITKDLQFVEGEDKFWLCSRDKKYLYTRLYDSNTLKQIRILYNTVYIDKIFFSSDKKYFFTRLNDTIEVRDSSTGDIIKQLHVKNLSLGDAKRHFTACNFCSKIAIDDNLRYFVLPNWIYSEKGNSFRFSGEMDRWLVYTKDGYFTASATGGTDLIAIKEDIKGFGIDQVALTYNRPDILLERLGSKEKERISFYNKRYEYRVKKAEISQLSNSSTPPSVKITAFEQKNNSARLSFEASEPLSTLSRYIVYINDTPVKEGSLSKAKENISLSIELFDRRNKIEVSVFNSSGLESIRDLKIAYLEKEKKGDLYYIGFGVSKYKQSSLNLGFAHQDALDLKKVFETKGKNYNKIYTKTLTDEEVTPESITMVNSIMEKTKPEDTVVVFIAGHGVYDKDGTYYYLTHNANPNDLKNSAASFEMIEELFKITKSRKKLFLMDTCESGEQEEYIEKQIYQAANTRGIKARTTRGLKVKLKSNKKRKPRPWLLERDRFLFTDLKRRTGTIVFSSSRGTEFSYESPKIKNGYFTEAILEALTSKIADKDKNRFISTDELREYVSKKVSIDTKKMQNPTVDRDNLEVNIQFGL